MVVPFTIHHEIVEYLFEESERLPEDFYVNIMDLMKKYHDKQEPHVYDEIRVYLDNNKNRINGDIFKKIKKPFPKRNLENLYIMFIMRTIAIVLGLGIVGSVTFIISFSISNKN